MKHSNIPVVYLASPYSYKSRFNIISKLVKYYRYKLITKIAAKLTEKHNIALICPITQSHQLGKYIIDNDGGFEKWKTIDLSYISKCDELWVVMMEGWKESEGVQAEIKFAKSKKIPIKYVNLK